MACVVVAQREANVNLATRLVDGKLIKQYNISFERKVSIISQRVPGQETGGTRIRTVVTFLDVALFFVSLPACQVGLGIIQDCQIVVPGIEFFHSTSQCLSIP